MRGMRSIFHAFVGLLFVVAGLAATPSAASADPVGSWIYINSPNTFDKCIDNPNSSTANVTLAIYDCHNGENQRWSFAAAGSGQYTIRNFTSNKCVTVLNASLADNAAIIQYTCNGGDNQRWRYTQTDDYLGTPIYQIQSVRSGKCITVKGGSRENNAPLLQYTCNGKANQTWFLSWSA